MITEHEEQKVFVGGTDMMMDAARTASRQGDQGDSAWTEVVPIREQPSAAVRELHPGAPADWTAVVATGDLHVGRWPDPFSSE